MRKILTSMLLSAFLLVGTVISTQAQVSFTMDTTWGCNSLTVTFTNTSTGGALGYYMDYGDGDDTTYIGKKNVVHTYNGSGTYDVLLAGFDIQQNLVGTDFNKVELLGLGGVDAQADTVCPGEEFYVQAWGSGDELIVDWGDGSNDTTNRIDEEVHHEYPNAGTYSVLVGMMSQCGLDTVRITIVSDSAASADSDFGMEPWQACPGETVQFWASGGEADSYMFSWDFDDGDTSNAAYPKHTFMAKGSYDITLLATNACGNSSSTTQTLLVDDTVGVNPWMDIEAGPPIACPGDPMQMQVNGGSDSYKYYWNFDDGSPIDSSGRSVTHFYINPGQYDVTVMVENLCGDRDTLDQTVGVDTTVSPFLNDRFGSTVEDGSCPGDSAIFWFGGRVGNGTLAWDFGDGNTGTATDTLTVEDGFVVTIVKHAYATIGTYTAVLTYTNGCGKSAVDSIEVEISANAPATAEFLLDAPMHGPNYLPCETIGILGLSGISYFWDFGDGDTMTTPNDVVGHAFDSPGNYNIELTVTNGCGNSDSYNESVEVVALPDVSVAVVSSNTAEATYSRGAVSYQWYKDGNILAGATNSTITASVDGAYTATAMDSLGCEATSMDTVALIANSIYSIGLNKFSVYPNPTRDLLNVSYSLVQTAEVNITLTDVMGKWVQNLYQGTQASGSHQTSINLNDANMATGIYFLSMEINGEVQYQKVSVLR